MPFVENHQVTIKGHATAIVRYVPVYEVPLALRAFAKGPRESKKSADAGVKAVPCDHSVPPALAAKNIQDVDKEYKACVAAYTLPVVEHVYPTRDDFRVAVEKAVLQYCSRTEKPPEVVQKAKSLGITLDQAKALAERSFRTVEQTQALDLTKLSAILDITPDKAQALRQKWFGTDDEDGRIPVVMEDE
jgi:hypothetical protein